MKILLLSAYDAMSHAYWRNGLVNAFPEHDWTVLTLPPRYFNWRLRGNSLSWAFGEREALEAGYDLLVCTSMTDLSALKGMVPLLSQIPTLCYFHENQFAYPPSARQNNSVEPLILNIYTALTADQVLFNTAYNRSTFLAGAEKLLKKLPDHVPAAAIERLKNNSAVLPVPLPERVFVNDKDNDRATDDQPLQILWNHRWEYDKSPERLFNAIRLLRQQTDNFTLHVVGQSFRQVPDIFKQAEQEFADVIGCWGYVESGEDYRALLKRCDVVVSTAIHDFQGIAILEGVAAGCIPLVPDRLAYSELFAKKYRYPSTIKDEEKEAGSLSEKLQKLIIAKETRALDIAPDIQGLSWTSLRPVYQNWMNQLASGS